LLTDGIFDQVLVEMVQFYAECLGIGWEWQAMDSFNSMIGLTSMEPPRACGIFEAI